MGEKVAQVIFLINRFYIYFSHYLPIEEENFYTYFIIFAKILEPTYKMKFVKLLKLKLLV